MNFMFLEFLFEKEFLKIFGSARKTKLCERRALGHP